MMLARRATPAVVVAILLMLLPACKKKGSNDVFCEAFESQFARCMGKPPPDSLRRVRDYCLGTMSYTPEEKGVPGNLAALTKAALEDCHRKEDCAAFMECLDRYGCAFLRTGPNDQKQSFQCMRPTGER